MLWEYISARVRHPALSRCRAEFPSSPFGSADHRMFEGGRTMARFPHRSKLDGSFDSICPRCFRTIASGQRIGDLVKAEKRHICDPADLITLKPKKIKSHPVRKDLRRKA